MQTVWFCLIKIKSKETQRRFWMEVWADAQNSESQIIIFFLDWSVLANNNNKNRSKWSKHTTKRKKNTFPVKVSKFPALRFDRHQQYRFGRRSRKKAKSQINMQRLMISLNQVHWYSHSRTHTLKYWTECIQRQQSILKSLRLKRMQRFIKLPLFSP